MTDGAGAGAFWLIEECKKAERTREKESKLCARFVSMSMARLSKLKLEQKTDSSNREQRKTADKPNCVLCVCVPIERENSKESKIQAKTVIECGRIRCKACYATEGTCWVVVVQIE